MRLSAVSESAKEDSLSFPYLLLDHNEIDRLDL